MKAQARQRVAFARAAGCAELPLAMYAVENIWPTLSDELGADVEYVKRGNLRLGKTGGTPADAP